MPKPAQKARSNRSALAKRAPRTIKTGRRNTSRPEDNLVFLNVGITQQARNGLNKLVGVLDAASQRDVLEQLIAAELHRRNLRLPRAA